MQLMTILWYLRLIITNCHELMSKSSWIVGKFPYAVSPVSHRAPKDPAERKKKTSGAKDIGPRILNIFSESNLYDDHTQPYIAIHSSTWNSPQR